jgi:quinol monooxygenase YgiN
MNIGRRELMIAALVIGTAASQDNKKMYGRIGKMSATTGQRDALIAILIDSINGMPGCISYVIAKGSTDENAIWITEVWDSKESHDASLSLPQVKKAIAAARPMIAGFGNNVITTPIGGFGLASH